MKRHTRVSSDFMVKKQLPKVSIALQSNLIKMRKNKIFRTEKI